MILVYICIYIYVCVYGLRDSHDASVGQPTKTHLQQLSTDIGCSQEDLPEVIDDRDELGKSVLAAQ